MKMPLNFPARKHLTHNLSVEKVAFLLHILVVPVQRSAHKPAILTDILWYFLASSRKMLR
jgi:hypothetical protein